MERRGREGGEGGGWGGGEEGVQRGALQLQLRSWGTAGGPDPPPLPAPSYKNIHNLEQVGIVLVNYWLLWISQERIVKGGCTLHIAHWTCLQMCREGEDNESLHVSAARGPDLREKSSQTVLGSTIIS